MADRTVAVLGLVAVSATVLYLIYSSRDGGDDEGGMPSEASGGEGFTERLDRVMDAVDYAKDATMCGFCKRELDKIKGATQTLKKVAPAATWIAKEKSESPI